jgi:hypothetical protein
MATKPPSRWPTIGGLYTPLNVARRDVTATRPVPLSPQEIEAARRAMYQREMEQRAARRAVHKTPYYS